MKQQLIFPILMSAAVVSQAATVTIDGARMIEVTPNSSTGLKSVYVLENSSSATITYISDGGAVQWQRYSNLGGGYAEDVTFAQSGDRYSISADRQDMGYIITEGGKQTCFWIVNYANHNYGISDISVTDSDCDRVYISPVGKADAIYYYTINGRREELNREISLTYYTLAYDEADEVYKQIATSQNYSEISGTISAPAPLCDTDFTLYPDRFSQQWGLGHNITSASFTTTAVETRTTATQTERNSDNEQKIEAELGGSAPCEILFKAAVSDAAIYHRWEISKDADFNEILYQYDQTEFTFEFTDAGTTYVRFIANNAAGSCEHISDVYSVAIGDSYLECPNAFSPGSSEGLNDEWKVSYRSVVEFDCQIFNRWGKRLAHLTDPSQGWDGKIGNKVVGSGTYFYVIKAIGSDGKKYNLSGDINVINSRKDTNSSVPTE